MATYHIYSVDQATAQSTPPTGRVIAQFPNPNNSNMCLAYDDNNFSSWSSIGATTKVQQVRAPGTGMFVAAMPNTNGGSPSFYGFPSLDSLLSSAQFVPDLGGGSIGGGAYGTVSDVANALSQQGGLLIISNGNVTDS
jgi:hypothetical protein